MGDWYNANDIQVTITHAALIRKFDMVEVAPSHTEMCKHT